jgi:gluconolactonase
MTAEERRSRRALSVVAGIAAAAAILIAWRTAAAEPAEKGRRITAVTLIHGLPGKEDELKQHLLSLAGPTRAEKGCITYDLYQSPDQKHEFMRFEVWESLDALEAHKKTPPLKASFEKRQREGWTTQIVIWNHVPEYPAVGKIERLDPRFDALVPSGAVLEKVADGMDWTEGPVWDVKSGALLFSDVPRNVILQWKEGAGVTERVRASGYSGKEPFAGREPGSNGLVFDRQGRLVTCQHGDRRIVRREPDGGVTVIAGRYEGKRLNSPNDLVFKSNGDLYFTDPPFGLPGTFDDPAKELPFQGVYRVTPDGRVTLLTRELSAPNGIGFSPDEKTLYVSNSDRKHPIWMAYPVRPDGTLGSGRQFAEASAWVKEAEGVADGLKLDKSGNVFGAGPGGIHVFAPDGTRLGRIETGVKTGNLNWGEDGSVLYIAANHWILRLRTSTKGKGF